MSGRVGIVGITTYFPKRFVRQADLEVFDGVSTGKYTKGLGQNELAFVNDREDIISLSLTAFDQLLTENRVKKSDIGRIEVGTETIVDHSKSVKSALMELMGDVTDVEGIDTTNACYGGTNALLNSVNWLSSPFHNGKFAVVLAGDIAVYEKGPARPTGGCGMVAMLLGRDPVLSMRIPRATYMEHAYDFYKPHLNSEYPVVDGHLSNDCYIRALDNCFLAYKDKIFGPTKNRQLSEISDYFLFHSPYSKLVQKSFARIYELEHPEAFEGVEDARERQKLAMTLSHDLYQQKVVPSLRLGLSLGNSYCGSLYCALHSLLVEKKSQLSNQEISMFSYGSGLAATMFGLEVERDVSAMVEASDFTARLASRKACSPEAFSEAMQLREDTHHLIPYQPSPINEDDFFPNTYVLDHVDELGRRKYKKL